MGFLRLVFTINYINVVQTYRKQKFHHASVASLGIGAREVSRSCAAKACLAYRRTQRTQASGGLHSDYSRLHAFGFRDGVGV